MSERLSITTLYEIMGDNLSNLGHVNPSVIKDMGYTLPYELPALWENTSSFHQVEVDKSDLPPAVTAALGDQRLSKLTKVAILKEILRENDSGSDHTT
jgi:hypothetical protein